MYISSMARSRTEDYESPFNMRTLRTKGTRRRNPDEDFILRGNKATVRPKPIGFLTNSEMTISKNRTGDTAFSRPLSAPPFEQFSRREHENFDPRELALDLSDFDDEQMPQRQKSKNKTMDDLLNASYNSEWFTRPVHRSPEPPVDLQVLRKTNPLEASVLKARNTGGLADEEQGDEINSISIDTFDLSLFRNAEEEMLTSKCRSLSGYDSPYQKDLYRLKKEQLKLQEERLLRKKCTKELERIRGPKPRWYEIKTKEFCKEAKLNNDILSLSGDYREIMNYRNQLLTALGEDIV